MVEINFKELETLLENYHDAINYTDDGTDRTPEELGHEDRMKEKILQVAHHYFDYLIPIAKIAVTLNDPRVDKDEFGYECFYCHNNLSDGGEHSDNCRWVRLQKHLSGLKEWME